jgi:hypothetical protein
MLEEKLITGAKEIEVSSINDFCWQFGSKWKEETDP